MYASKTAKKSVDEETQNSLKTKTAYPLQSANDAKALSKTLFNENQALDQFRQFFALRHASRQLVYSQCFCVNFDWFVCAVPRVEVLESSIKLRNKMPFHLRK